MNTPAHIAASLLLWRNEPGWRGALAVAFGASLPDLPMFGFYAYQRINGRSEGQIWSTLYFENHWQTLFDVFNSIPLALAAIVICIAIRQPLGVLVAASAAVHMLCDLPVHNDDAHRHLWPIDWRFASPVSYWDPKHFGFVFAPLELLFAVAASWFVASRGAHKPMRVLGRINLGLYGIVLLTIAAFLWRFIARQMLQ